jgi:hypothetical protein
MFRPRVTAAMLVCLFALPGIAAARVSLTPMATSPLTDTGQGGQIKAVDFNGDGLDDLAIGSARAATGGVHIRMAAPDGSWSTKATLATGNATGEIAPGDFDQDGDQDLLVNLPDPVHPLEASGSFRVFLGNGDGTFTAGQTLGLQDGKVFAVPPSGQSMLIGNANDDEIPDLVVGLTHGQIGIAMGVGDGTFTVIGTGTFPDAPTGGNEGFGPITEGDFNEDGIRDLVFGLIGNSASASTEDDTGFYVLYGRDGGNFDAPLHIPIPEPYGPVTRLISGEAGDDGSYLLVDAAADDGLTSRQIVYPGGPEGFNTLPTTIFNHPFPVLPATGGEFSGDGIEDLAWVEQPGGATGEASVNDLRVATGSATEPFALQATAFGLNFAGNQGTASMTAPGDFNGDGATDLAAAFGSSDCSVQGCGTAVLLNRPVISASRTSFDFGTIGQRAGSTTVPLILTNEGGAPSKAPTVITSQTEPARFGLTSECGPIPPGGSCSTGISFDTSAAGVSTGHIEIHFEGVESAIRLTLNGTVRAPEIPVPTYKAVLRLTGPKKAKAGRKFKLSAQIINTGTGALSGTVLKWKAAQGRKVKRQGQIKLATIAVGKKVNKPVAVAIARKNLTRGKPVSVTVTLIQANKTLATKKFNVRQKFSPVRVRR